MSDLVAFLTARLDEREAQHTSNWRNECDRCGEHSPCWTMRDIEAKRKLIDWHSAQRSDETPWGDPVQICRCGYDLPCSTLRMLALPDVDHPDYKEEWRP